MIRRSPAHFLALLAVVGAPARGADPPTPAVSAYSSGPFVATIPLQPAVEPRPSLRYRLVVEPTRRKRANAALFIHRALLIRAERLGRDQAQGGPADYGTLINWINGPAGDLPREPARRLLNSLAGIRREVALAVECDHADWQFDRPDNGVAFLMPEIQESRDLGRILALEARLAIVEGRLDDAFEAIRTEVALARQVADGPNLIQALVGLSLTDRAATGLRDLVAAPGAPSLFWALADRPRPIIDLRAGLDSERFLLDADVPDLRAVEEGVWSVERCRRCVADLSRLVELNAPNEPGAGLRPLDVALFAARTDAEGRRALIAAGSPRAEVDALPLLQVALRTAHRDYLDRRDALFCWANIPYAQAPGRLNSLADIPAIRSADPLLAAMLTVHAGGLEAARLAGARLERWLDAWQVVEAIRLDATRHGGRLPVSLDAIADLPLPLDSITGRPFGYRVEGNTAIVSGLTPADSANRVVASLAFEIRLTPPTPTPTPTPAPVPAPAPAR